MSDKLHLCGDRKYYPGYGVRVCFLSFNHDGAHASADGAAWSTPVPPPPMNDPTTPRPGQVKTDYTPLTDAELERIEFVSIHEIGEQRTILVRRAAAEIRALRAERAERAETLACIRDALGLLNDRTANNMPRVGPLNQAMARLRARLPQPVGGAK